MKLNNKFDNIDQTNDSGKEAIPIFYDKVIFMSEKQEQEWNDMSPAIKHSVQVLLAESIYKVQQKIIEEYSKM